MATKAAIDVKVGDVLVFAATPYEVTKVMRVKENELDAVALYFKDTNDDFGYLYEPYQQMEVAS